jgi:tetratricopeptide (TPR) repeat protein
LLSGCTLWPSVTNGEDVYDLQRQAIAAYDDGEDAKAERVLMALLRTSPNDSLSWFYLGNLYARTDRPDQAVEAYQKSLMLNNGDPRAWHNMGVIRLRQARAAFIQAYDLTQPEDPLHGKAELLINAMEKIPLDAMREKPAAPERNAAKQ